MSFGELAERYNALTKRALALDYIVRDSGLQAEMIAELGSFRELLKAAKESATRAGIEPLANTLFLFQCMVNAIQSSLTVWLKIKASEPANAWEALVDAQEYVSIALRIPVPQASDMSEYAQHLAQVEVVVFPGWPMYLSAAFIENGSGDCSICGLAYDSCNLHVEGLVYWGRLCERVNRDIQEAHHTAFVDTPHDKRCIVRSISTDEGYKRDYITWKVSDERFDGEGTANGVTAGSRLDVIVFTTKRLDVD